MSKTYAAGGRRRRWMVSCPRWSWLLQGARRKVELEHRHWSPGDVVSGFYLHVGGTEDCPGLFDLALRSDSHAGAEAEAESAFDALEAGELHEWLLRRDEGA